MEEGFQFQRLTGSHFSLFSSDEFTGEFLSTRTLLLSSDQSLPDRHDNRFAPDKYSSSAVFPSTIRYYLWIILVIDVYFRLCDSNRRMKRVVLTLGIGARRNQDFDVQEWSQTPYHRSALMIKTMVCPTLRVTSLFTVRFFSFFY